jgi:hypothetical protein
VCRLLISEQENKGYVGLSIDMQMMIKILLVHGLGAPVFVLLKSDEELLCLEYFDFDFIHYIYTLLLLLRYCLLPA